MIEMDNQTEVMRITRDGVWVHPDITVDETARAVLGALDSQIKVLVQRAVEDEREACEEAVEEVARKYRRQHYADAENIADECAEAIRARGAQ